MSELYGLVKVVGEHAGGLSAGILAVICSCRGDSQHDGEPAQETMFFQLNCLGSQRNCCAASKAFCCLGQMGVGVESANERKGEGARGMSLWLLLQGLGHVTGAMGGCLVSLLSRRRLQAAGGLQCKSEAGRSLQRPQACREWE